MINSSPILTFVTLSFFINAANCQAATTAPHTCKSGSISTTPCKSSLFRKTCEDKTLTCEDGKFCCPPSNPKNPTNSSSNCDRCDVHARLECLSSIQSNNGYGSATRSPSSVPACNICQNCCADAYLHSCEVWKNKGFCQEEWYSILHRKLLCGRSCGLC